MDSTHVHLVITHLPIFGSALGVFVLILGLIMKSNQTKIAAYGVYIISSLGAGIAYFTGEAAEGTVERIASVSEIAIETHEEFASIALTGMIVLGIAALIAILLTIKYTSISNKIAIILLLVSSISFGLVARAGYLGGQIRHTEISKGGTPLPASVSSPATEIDDD